MRKMRATVRWWPLGMQQRPNIMTVRLKIWLLLTLFLLLTLVALSGMSSRANAQITLSSPYPKWFFSFRDSSPRELIFRMFGYEGMARNLFVLSCKGGRNVSSSLELIPPKGLEQKLRTFASAVPKATTVRVFDGEGALTRLAEPLFESRGEYDKIAAFIDMSAEEQLFAFLQLLQHEKLLVRWEQANIQYILHSNEYNNDQFVAAFRAKLLEGRHEELSYQDVYIRCSKLWSR
jgi:hypothetical protein